MVSKMSGVVECLTTIGTFVRAFVGVDEVVSHEICFPSEFRIAEHTHESSLSIMDYGYVF